MEDNYFEVNKERLIEMLRGDIDILRNRNKYKKADDLIYCIEFMKNPNSKFRGDKNSIGVGIQYLKAYSTEQYMKINKERTIVARYYLKQLNKLFHQFD